MNAYDFEKTRWVRKGYTILFPTIKNTMSTLLFSLRGVPDDEAFEIRELLTSNNIDYYETSAGNWGISMPALWIRDNEDLHYAQTLLNEYHIHRARTQREINDQLKKQHNNKQLIDVFTEKPLRLILYLAAIAFILYLYVRMLSEFGL